jgi:hypothetical protein
MHQQTLERALKMARLLDLEDPIAVARFVARCFSREANRLAAKRVYGAAV